VTLRSRRRSPRARCASMIRCFNRAVTLRSRRRWRRL
jgi:hypothetical protein